MKLREAPFSAIKEGRKDIELRLYDEKRKKIALGDYIIFQNAQTGERLYTLVKGLHPYPDFASLFAAFPGERLGYQANETAHPSDMQAYYSEEEVRACGVLGIELALQRELYESVDIYSKGDYPADALSNFASHPFTLDGVVCASMEGFLQALKYKSPEKQREICALTGKRAKEAGKGKFLFKLTGSLFWQGQRIRRRREEYTRLVRRAYEAMLLESEDFRLALICAQDRPLTHTLGKRTRLLTVLTERELIDHLNAMRDILRIKGEKQ